MRESKTSLKAVGTRRNFQSAIISEEARQAMIAEAAYYIAEKRGFQGGDPVSDWLAAQREIADRFAR
jgi:hypothetical protein